MGEKSKKRKSDPDWIRTNDLQLRRLPLYPTELPDPISEIEKNSLDREVAKLIKVPRKREKHLRKQVFSIPPSECLPSCFPTGIPPDVVLSR